MVENYDKSFFILTQLSDEFKLERELYEWHLEYVVVKKNIVCKKQYIDGLCGRDSLKEILNEIFDETAIDFNDSAFSQDCSVFYGLTRLIERLFSIYDWMQLSYKQGKWRFASLYNIDLYNKHEMQEITTEWNESLMGLVEGVLISIEKGSGKNRG